MFGSNAVLKTQSSNNGTWIFVSGVTYIKNVCWIIPISRRTREKKRVLWAAEFLVNIYCVVVTYLFQVIDYKFSSLSVKKST